MYSIVYTLGMIFLWVVNLLNNTGTGNTYKTTEIASLVAVFIAILCLASQILRQGDLLVKPRYFYTILPMSIIFVAVSLLNGQNLAGLEGFWVYVLVYILSKTRPNLTAIRLTSIAYGVLGLVILYIYDFMTILKGWNANSIGIIGLFSFLIFTIPFFGMREWRSFVFMPLIGSAYVYLIWPTDSRSCIVVILVTLLLVLRIIRVRKLLTSSKAIALLLLVPVFVAVFTCLLSTFGDISGLTAWSKEVFEKEAFSGRDLIWMDGFNQLRKHFFFGSGVITGGYWHNSAIACLVAFGTVGYGFWIKLFHVILKEGQPYVDDMVVEGSMVAFLALSCHQSVELGIFAPNPSLLPYLILGIMLGRINYLRSEAHWQR